MNRFYWYKGKVRFKPIIFLTIVMACGLVALASLNQASAQDEGGRPPTQTPTATPTIQPSGIPACPEELHNPNEWHPLLDPVYGCHYDHEHKHNPNDVADIFGPPGAWFGGTSISYPWETSQENMHKHEAYSWIVRRDIPTNGKSQWIKDFRWQVHATSAPFTMADGTMHGGYLGRFHSYSLEAQVCDGFGTCGIVRTGGWFDFGHLEISGINDCVFLPSDPSQEETCANLGRRRIHYFYQGAGMPNGSSFFWYGRAGALNGPLPILHPVQVAVATGDGSVNVIPTDLYNLNFFCPAWDCQFNNSTIQAHSLAFSIPVKLDPDKDGRAYYSGFTDRYGVEVTGCTVASLDCVPFSIEGAPTGRFQHRDDRDLGLSPAGMQDFDTSPLGEWWIEYPDPPMPPMPETTPEPTAVPTREPNTYTIDPVAVPIVPDSISGGKH